jgi:hypothetical protein
MRIKNFKLFSEAISGTEMIGSMGPNYGEAIGPKTITSSDTDTVYSELKDKIFSRDEYEDLYHKYLAKGGKPLHGFNSDNLEEVLLVLSK